MNTKQVILGAVTQLATDLIEYHKSEDLGSADIKQAINCGEISTAQICNHFESEFRRLIK